MSSVADQLITLAVPFHKLEAWPDNVRTDGTNRKIAELASSIHSHGLLQSLVVRRAAKGKYLVLAGRRRYQALTQLVEQHCLPKSFPVPCRVADASADSVEVGLVENVHREPMHPADEFLAFQRLIDNGFCAADVAARFGVSELVVSRRLALARVNPMLITKYREGLINLEGLQAFTVTDDQQKQQEVWESLPSYDRNAYIIRRRLSCDDLSASDKVARFVGLDAYEAAGGVLRRDLFSEGEQGVSIVDRPLLYSLATQKLNSLASVVKREGWKWVEIQLDGPSYRHSRVSPDETGLSPDEQQLLETLQTEYGDLVAEHEEEIDPDEKREELLCTLSSKIDFLAGKRYVYSDHLKARCGVKLLIEHSGEIGILYGLVHPGDESADSGVAKSEQASSPEEKPTISVKLLEELTTEKTVAIAAELTTQPRVAIAALAHALISSVFRLELDCFGLQSSIQVTAAIPPLSNASTSSKAHNLISTHHQDWVDLLPKDSQRLWLWCLEQPDETILRLLAYCISRSLNGIEDRRIEATSTRAAHCNAIAAALQMDMNDWFIPTVANYFEKISKSTITEDLLEAGQAATNDPTWKKKDLAALAEKKIAGTGWLPKPLRLSK